MDADPPPGPPPPLEMRPASADGAEEARALLADAYAEAGLPAGADRMADFPDGLRAAGGEWWTLALRGVVAGAVGIRPGPEPGEASLCGWGLARAWRGLGLGRWMAERALAHARRPMGCRTAAAEAVPAARQAARVLAGMGFRPPGGGAFDAEKFDRATVLRKPLGG